MKANNTLLAQTEEMHSKEETSLTVVQETLDDAPDETDKDTANVIKTILLDEKETDSNVRSDDRNDLTQKTVYKNLAILSVSFLLLFAAIQSLQNLQSRINEPCHEKTNILVSDLVRHKPGCTTTQDG